MLFKEEESFTLTSCFNFFCDDNETFFFSLPTNHTKPLPPDKESVATLLHAHGGTTPPRQVHSVWPVWTHMGAQNGYYL